ALLPELYQQVLPCKLAPQSGFVCMRPQRTRAVRFDQGKKFPERSEQYRKVQRRAQNFARRHHRLLAPQLRQSLVKISLKPGHIPVKGHNLLCRGIFLSEDFSAFNAAAVIDFSGGNKTHLGGSEVPTLSSYQPG